MLSRTQIGVGLPAAGLLALAAWITACAQTPEGPRIRPDVSYGPLQAGRDAHRMAEEARRRAIDRQLQLLGEVTWYGAYAYEHDPAAYASYPGPLLAYGPRRAMRRAYRWGYGPAWWPYVYGYPYYPWMRQPLGHEKIWTSPNSYLYRPRYQPPEARPQRPTPADPTTRPREPQPQPPQFQPPEIPARPAPERIPPPPAESGPREF